MTYRKNNIYFFCSEIDLSIKKDVVTGQSVITNYVFDILNKDYNVFLKLHKTNQSNIFFITLRLIKQILHILLSFKKFEFGYLVISRSKFGFIRDSLLMITFFIRKIKVIVHIHGSDIIYTRNYSEIHRYLFKLLKNSINIVPSKTLKNELFLLNIESIFLSNFSTLFYLNQKEIYNFSDCKKDFITILWNSNIIYSKGFYHLSEALLNIYNSGFKKIKFQILGRIVPDDNIDLFKYIDEIRKYKFIEYIGPVDNEEAYKFLINSNIVALPSFYKTECQPLALIDAIVANKYLLISNNKYLMELTEGYDKLIFQLPLRVEDMSRDLKSNLISFKNRELKDDYNKIGDQFKHYVFKDKLRKLLANI
tara:strand:- start:1081 stop:2175 length:1095 start_codon:yes stop_codon:yes gene_type:complete